MQLIIQSPAASPIKFKSNRLLLGLAGLVNYNGFNQVYDWWKVGSPHTVYRTADGTATVAPGSPGVFTKAAHGLQANAPLRFKNIPSGTGLSGGVYYYVVATGLTANTFSVSATKGGAALAVGGAGGNIDIDASLRGRMAIDAGYLTEDLELVDPLPPDAIRMEKQFFVASGNVSENYDNEQFNLTFTGTANKVEMFSGGTGATQPGNTSPTTLKFGTNPKQAWLWFFLTPGQSNPPRGIKCYQSRYAADVGAGKKLNRDWINVIKEFGLLRCMDLMRTNNSLVTEFEDFATESYTDWTNEVPSGGAKYGTPLSYIAEVAKETGREIWVCIPHKSSDACVQAMAQFFKDNVPQKVYFEYTNEPWNGLFAQAAYCAAQGISIWGSLDDNRGLKWSGYRSAQCMKIIRDVYNDRSRWGGIIAPQNANIGTFDQMMVGVDRYLITDLGGALTTGDLYEDSAGTGYFAAAPMTDYFVASITREANALVTVSGSDGHDYQVNHEVGFGFNQLTGSMRELEAYNPASTTRVYATIIEVPALPADSRGKPKTFRINIDTTNFSPYAAGDGFVIRSNVFRLMDLSEAKNESDPVNYPTKYTYFAQQLSSVFITGECSSGLMSVSLSINSMVAGVWLQHIQRAAARGLGFRQYEGGCHWIGNNPLKSNGINSNRLCSRYFDYLRNTGHSLEFAKAYSEMYRQFRKIGGHHPAKFVEAGAVTIHGSWPGTRWQPFGNNATSDVDNPVWKATRAGNKAYFAP